MTRQQYAEFDAVRTEFREYAASLSRRTPWLGSLQEKLRLSLGYADYRIETPIVYNRALDDITRKDEPRFVIVADNPGKNEQKAANQRYLVGQSGKLAQGWFAKELGLDFRAAAVIVNKTPLHTPKTAEIARLRALAAEESAQRREELDRILEESQRTMARFAYRLHSCLGAVSWISGYGELGPKGLFAPWSEETRRLYADAPRTLKESLWVFRHFSMNQFAIEYKRYEGPERDPLEKLAAIGEAHRMRVLGW